MSKSLILRAKLNEYKFQLLLDDAPIDHVKSYALICPGPDCIPTLKLELAITEEISVQLE